MQKSREQVLNDALALMPWCPQKGPQFQAFCSEADIILYGGAAGGGKSALACGLATTKHRETLYIRREATQLGAVVDEVANIFGSRDGFNGAEKIWRIPPYDGVKRKITFGSTPHLGDEQRYQGRPRDLLVIDEACHLLEIQARFLMGWVRTTVVGQRCRTLLCTNPPTSAEGEWIIRMFAAWLDPAHPNRAAPGELRWYAMIDGKELERDDGEPFEHNGERITPQSRTFIPAKITDNKYLMDTGYMAQLQAMPEPLRSQMLYGDFLAGREDDEWQVIPSEWVKLAQDRWVDRELPTSRLSAVGVDPSRGGRDNTVVSRRYGWWYAALDVFEGHAMTTGGKVAAKVLELIGTSACPVHIDIIGIGASVIDHLDVLIGSRAIPVDSRKSTDESDFSGHLRFANYRAKLWWQFRDRLNPENGFNVALPPDTALAAELCAPTYALRGNGIQIETKEDIIKRLGRSTDRADGVIYAAEHAPIMTDNNAPSSRFSVRGSLDR